MTAVTTTNLALFVTMLSPGDKVPVPQMLFHHYRQLGQRNIAEVLVLDNQNGPRQPQEAIETLSQLGVPVAPVDHAVLNDSTFLDRFFRAEAGASPLGVPGLDVVERLSEWTEKRRSYMSGILHFIDRCQRASDRIGMCVFLDADIFLHRAQRGLIDLAYDVFEARKELLGLQPPTVCHSHVPLGRDGLCEAKNWWHLSSRNMILHRGRLKAALPLHVRSSDFDAGLTRFWQFASWTNMFSSVARRHGWIGWMQCGSEAFAIHPDRSLQEHDHHYFVYLANRLERGLFDRPGRAAMRYRLEQIGRLQPLSNTSAWLKAWSVVRGQGQNVAPDYVASNMCQDMVHSSPRMSVGLAW
eukprot:TRINITY_DN72997_c0_g1_i1.p1 TRINITY_DN72997_c0_g1~~TRINITY_DN72997_c0_g1_i1.p1  ORF type:complete len:355 (-),score=51.96 TRINITY_DN72997_c0_g1_i1:177-1241(-)